jgi:hypothetical protein
MEERGFMLILWSVKKNQRQRGMKAKLREQDSRDTAQPAHKAKAEGRARVGRPLGTGRA